MAGRTSVRNVHHLGIGRVVGYTGFGVLWVVGVDGLVTGVACFVVDA